MLFITLLVCFFSLSLSQFRRFCCCDCTLPFVDNSFHGTSRESRSYDISSSSSHTFTQFSTSKCLHSEPLRQFNRIISHETHWLVMVVNKCHFPIFVPKFIVKTIAPVIIDDVPCSDMLIGVRKKKKYLLKQKCKINVIHSIYNLC